MIPEFVGPANLDTSVFRGDDDCPEIEPVNREQVDAYVNAGWIFTGENRENRGCRTRESIVDELLWWRVETATRVLSGAPSRAADMSGIRGRRGAIWVLTFRGPLWQPRVAD